VDWRIFARAFTTGPQVLAVNPTTAEVHEIAFPGGFPRQVLVARNRFVIVSDTTLYEQSRRFEPVHDFVQDAAMNASGVLWFQSQRTLFVSPDRGDEPVAVDVGQTGRLVEGSAIAGVTPDGSAVVRLPDGGVLLAAADGSTSIVDTGGGQVLAADGGGVAVVSCAVSTCDTEFRSWAGLVVRLGVRAEFAQFSPSGSHVLTAFARSGLQFLDLATSEVVGEINRFSMGGAWAPDGSAYVSTSPATSALVVVDLDRVAGIASRPFDGPVEVAAVG
jgi:sugar lactone lactonase YvrE